MYCGEISNLENFLSKITCYTVFSFLYYAIIRLSISKHPTASGGFTPRPQLQRSTSWFKPLHFQIHSYAYDRGAACHRHSNRGILLQVGAKPLHKATLGKCYHLATQLECQPTEDIWLLTRTFCL